MTITNQEVIDEFKDAQGMARSGGAQAGGGPSAADQDAAGGSSGGGGYGAAQLDLLGVGEAGGGAPVTGDGLSRGERLDMEADGGRGDDALDADGDEDAGARPRRAFETGQPRASGSGPALDRRAWRRAGRQRPPGSGTGARRKPRRDGPAMSVLIC